MFPKKIYIRNKLHYVYFTLYYIEILDVNEGFNFFFHDIYIYKYKNEFTNKIDTIVESSLTHID